MPAAEIKLASPDGKAKHGITRRHLSGGSPQYGTVNVFEAIQRLGLARTRAIISYFFTPFSFIWRIYILVGTENASAT